MVTYRNGYGKHVAKLKRFFFVIDNYFKYIYVYICLSH